MKANKENIIDWILIELIKGTTFKDCFTVIYSKGKLSEKTFTNYWNEANVIYAQNQAIKREELLKANSDEQDEFISDLILTKKEALEILTKIIRAENEIRVNREGIEYSAKPSFFDRISAMGIMNRMRGWDMPLKVDNTIEVGKSIERTGSKVKFNLDLSSAI